MAASTWSKRVGVVTGLRVAAAGWAAAGWAGAAVAVGGAAAVLGAPAPAAACGGFFCNASLPVLQSAEGIAFFWNDDGSIEAHVQIFYTGPAERFGWILPVPGVPELDVGTPALFSALDGATRPTFDLRSRTEGTCRPYPSCDAYRPPDWGWADAAAADAFTAGDGGRGVDVLSRDNVGPYDAAVLAATDAASLLAWLRDNDYDIPASSMPEIMHYVDTGHRFVALKLLKNRNSGDIQPIVLRYAAGEPCIPLRLTRIAATPDMPVTAYVFASQGVRSSNYVMATPDLDDPGLWLGGARYEDKVSRAVDEAGGRAFVTDYRGRPPAISIELPSVAALAEESDPRTFVSRLVALGFVSEPQLAAIVARFVPPLDGTDPSTWLNCLAGFGFCADIDSYLASRSWDLAGAAAEIERAIVRPRREAQRLVARYATLSRLYTTISPDEMTEDPMFVRSAALGGVSNVHTATQVRRCSPMYFEFDAPTDLELPSGRTVRVSAGRMDTRSDDAICTSIYGAFRDGGAADGSGGDLDGGARTGAGRPEPRGGGLCTAAAPGSRSGAATVAVGGLLAALAGLARRRRRTRSPARAGATR
jgi:hypothetical protein